MSSSPLVVYVFEFDRAARTVNDFERKMRLHLHGERFVVNGVDQRVRRDLFGKAHNGILA